MTPTRTRGVLVLQYLGRKLDEITPTYNAFLVGREAIVQEGTCDVLKELLNVEQELYQERGSLEIHIQSVHHEDNKMAFILARSSLCVVEKKLKETGKQLNRSLVESKVVNINLNKLLEEFAWIKQRIDAKEVVERLWNGTNQRTGRSRILDTTIQKMDSILVKEQLILQQIADMKNQAQELETGERNLEALRHLVASKTLDLTVFQNGKNPHLLARKRNAAEKMESTHRLHLYQEGVLRENINNANDQIREQNYSRLVTMSYLRKEINSSEEELRSFENTVEIKQVQLTDLILNAESKRQHNLKEVLQLRVKWQHHEREQHEITMKKKRQEEAEEQELKRNEAVKLINNRLVLLYRSKFRKKVIPKVNSKKGKKKKKHK